MEKLGYKNYEQREFLEQIGNKTSQQFFNETELLQYIEDIVGQINPKLVQVFGPEVLKPEVLDLQIKAAPYSGSSVAKYKRPSLDGKQKGTFYINLEKVDDWKRYETMAVTLHLGNPGHNLQVFNLTSLTPAFKFGFWQ